MGDFCKEYLGDKYDYVYTVHTDTKHTHAHVIFNSVSRTTGLKYHYKKGDWEKYIQSVTDKVCEKHGYDKFEYEGGEHKDYGEWLKERKGGLTWKNIIKNDIDFLIPKVKSYQEFLDSLAEKGYKIRKGNSKKHGEYLAITPEDGKKAVRSYQLGKGYQPEDIKKRIQNKSKIDSFRPDKTVRVPRIKTFRYRNRNLLAQQFYATSYQFYYIKRYCQDSVLYHYQNVRNYNDIRKTEQATKACKYLLRNHIKTESELWAREKVLKEKLEDLFIQRNSLYRNGLSEEEKRIFNQYQSLQQKQIEAMETGNDLACELFRDEMEKLENKFPMEKLKELQNEKDKQLSSIREDIKTIKAEERMIKQIRGPLKENRIKEDKQWKNMPIQPKK